ncbi:MAG: DUF2809 domain-containing protein [candidate division KSB1 bacterium]|nr:DUF2809 domain-containing protein [candidate division KSB1 bacterium]
MNAKRVLIALLVVVPLGFAFKFYKGPLNGWFNDYGAGVLYEVFWILLASLLFPAPYHRVRIAAAVFVITCGLEFLQLWNAPFLNGIRRSFLGAAVLGSTFSWLDFPHYAIGCLLGYYLLRGVIATGSSSGSVRSGFLATRPPG